MLTPRRFPRKTALLLVIVAVLFSIPRAGQAAASAGPAQAVSAHAVSAQAVLGQPAAAQLAAGQHAPGQPIIAQTLAATSPAGPSGGLCSVPGIGDIGGLLGFCSLGSAGLAGDLNSVCEPSVPDPEPANGGIDSLVKPPATSGRVLTTPYNQYGVAGQYWAATNLQCSDMTSLIGNSVAGMLFDVAKSIDRVTITVYQSAAGENIIAWLRNAADRLITSLGNAIYFPYVAIVVIIGAIWLAWQGLIRKRGTRTIEGTVWMVVACAAAIWLIGRPADFTGIGKGVTDGISTTLNTAFSKLPSPGQDSCLPVQKGDPQIQPSSFSYTSGNTVVDQNANELWTVLACKPWLDGELGSTAFAASGGKPTVVNAYARQLLWSQAIAVNEKPTAALIKAKQATYTGIGQSIQQQDPGIYGLFQGKEWTTRLEIAFAALLAAVVAGVLVLLISVTLILLKLGFLLLLIVGPFFLLVGTHPGFGRVVAVRWFELLVGVLLKQAAVALALSVLLYSYALIMGTSDAVLPWALKILMIALVTIAVFIYRKPFQHLFSAVGYGVIGSRERAELDLRNAGSTMRRNTRSAATVAVPGFAAYRAARWARRNPAQAASLGLGSAALGGSGAAAGAADAGHAASAEGAEVYPAADGYGSAGGPDAPDGTHVSGRSGRTGLGARVRAWGGSAGNGAASYAPPLNLPAREAPVPTSPGWTRGGDAPHAGRAAASHSAPDAIAAPPAALGSSAPASSAPAGGAVPVPPPLSRTAARNSAARLSPPAAPATGDSRVPGGPGSGSGSGPGSRSGSLWSGAARPSGSQPTRQPRSQPDVAGPPALRPVPPPARPAGPPAAWPGGSTPARQAAPQSPAPARPAASQSPAPARPAAPSPVWPGGSGPARPAASQPPAPARPAAPPARPASPAPARQAGAPVWSGGSGSARPSAPAGAWPASARPSGPAPAQPAERRDGPAEAGGRASQSESEGPLAGGTDGHHRPESPAPFWLRPIRRRK